jgi:mono/diheme cytochrome c family protein
MGRRIALWVGVLAGVSGGAAAGVTQTGKSTADAVYTEAQATKGKDLFHEKCESCHNPEKFSGAEWTRAYVGRPLSEVSGAMAEMPMDNPGSLTAEETGALIGYFLSMNKYPAGETALSGEADALKAIMVGPRPQ